MKRRAGIDGCVQGPSRGVLHQRPVFKEGQKRAVIFTYLSSIYNSF